jgi:hypothetical protein
MHRIVIIVVKCNVDFVSFHNVTCCTNPLLSCILVNTANLMIIMCTLVATGVILGRLDCIKEFSASVYQSGRELP